MIDRSYLIPMEHFDNSEYVESRVSAALGRTGTVRLDQRKKPLLQPMLDRLTQEILHGNSITAH